LDPLYENWLKEFPPPDPMKEEIQASSGDKAAVKATIVKKVKEVSEDTSNICSMTDTVIVTQCVYWWYFNHTRSTSSGMDNHDSQKLTSKKRVIQGFQAYLQLYYEEKVKNIVKQKYQEHIDTVSKENQKSRFVFMAALTKELFDKETAEVKAEAENYRQKEKMAKVIKLDGIGEDGEPIDKESQQ
jgi:hypothetical protein